MLSRPALMLGVSLLVVSCGGSEPTNEGDLELAVVTTGADLDADGYTASIDGATPTVLGASQTRTSRPDTVLFTLHFGDIPGGARREGIAMLIRSW